jgi:hypothetical protein
MAILKTRTVSRKSDLISAALIIFIFICVALISSLEKALAFSVTFGVFLAIIQTKWENRKNKRFWIILTILAIIHVVVLSLIHIPELRFGLICLPFALADGFAMWGLINWIERCFPAKVSG